MTTYPTWRYHVSKQACVVNTEEEDCALGDGWHDSPAKCVKEVHGFTEQEPLPDGAIVTADIPKRGRKPKETVDE